MIRIPLGTKTGNGRSIALSAERLVNMYAEQAPEGGRSSVVVHGCPGLTLFGSVSDKIRGIHVTPADGKMYVVAGSILYSISSVGVAASIGTIAGYGRVGMADNGTQLCIVTGARGYTYSLTDGLETISDRDFPGADTVTFIDGFFVFNNRSNGQKGQFFISSLLDGQVYDALDFATAERYPDNLVRVFADHSELLLFGDESIEIWFNAGAADFPFARAQGSVIEQGLGARWTVEKVDESVFWLDQEGIVRRLQGNTPLRVSTHAIENRISKGDWTNATAYSYTMEGHQFYCLTVPAANLSQTAGTYCFDAATGLWHERKSYEMDYSRVGFYVRAFGKHVVGDIDSGSIYEMSLDAYQENGEHLVAEMVFPQVQNDGGRFIVNRFQLDIEVGTTGAVAGQTYSYTEQWQLVTDLQYEASDTLYGAAYGNGIWMFGDSQGIVTYSTSPLESWSYASAAAGGNLSLSFGNNIFVAASTAGSISTSLNGASWTSRTVPSVVQFNVIAYGDGLFVVGGNSNTLITSPDGITWTAKTITGLTNVRGVCYNGSRWLAIGSTGKAAYSDDGGDTWTSTADAIVGTANFNMPNMLSYGNGIWGYINHANQAYKSSDGLTWSATTSPFNDATSLNFGEGLFFATGYTGIATSPDMVTWTNVTITGLNGYRWSSWFGDEGWMIGADNQDSAISLKTTSYGAVGSDSTDPKVMLDVSGNTRTFDMTQGWRSIGKKGEYDKRVIWRRLGQFRSFTPKVSISSPVKRAVFAAYADIEPSR